MLLLVASVCTPARLHLREKKKQNNETACPSYCTSANKAIRAHCCESQSGQAGSMSLWFPIQGQWHDKGRWECHCQWDKRKKFRPFTWCPSELKPGRVLPSHKVLTHSSLCSDPDPVPSRTTQGVFVFSRPPERQILMFSFKLVRILGENRVCLFMWTEGCENKRTIQTNLPKHFLFSVKI